MTVIRLDAATLAQFKTATGEVVLADESGTPVRLCVLPPVPDREPDCTGRSIRRSSRDGLPEDINVFPANLFLSAGSITEDC